MIPSLRVTDVECKNKFAFNKIPTRRTVPYSLIALPINSAQISREVSTNVEIYLAR